jgi:hypothetical protein
VALMPCDPSVVDIMMSAYVPQVKYRLCVGYHISQGLYAMRKFGLVSPRVAGEVHPQDTMMRACEHTYHGIPTSGEITIPIFGYDLGEPCEYDDDGVPIGLWPPIGEATITSTEKFLMKGSRWSPGYAHLMPIRWRKP